MYNPHYFLNFNRNSYNRQKLRIFGSSTINFFTPYGTVNPGLQKGVFQTKGTTEEWTDLSRDGVRNYSGSSSNTRGVLTGGYHGADPGLDEAWDFSLVHQGVVASFGDLTAYNTYCTGVSSGVRGLAAGGNQHPNPSVKTIDTYIFATRSNTTDFGDLTAVRKAGQGGGNGVQCTFGGGSDGGTLDTTIDITTFASTGTCVEFGDYTSARNYGGGVCQGAGHLIDYLAHSYTKNYPLQNYEMGNMILLGPGDSGRYTVEYVNIMSTGNSAEFGDTTGDCSLLCGMGSNATKATFLGGYDYPGGAASNGIEYCYFASKGNSASWGDMTHSDPHPRGAGNSTRGLISDTSSNKIVDYITWASEGDAVDFGDLSVESGQMGAAASTTRAVYVGGATGPTYLDKMEYFTIASTGNYTDFGDTTVATSNMQGDSSATRGVFGGGTRHPGANSNVIEYLTIASTGDMTDFGDLTVARTDHSGAGNVIRVGWFSGNGDQVTSDYISIASTGNAADFGDVKDSRRNHSAACDGHGGL